MSQVNIVVSTETGAAEGNLTRLESKIDKIEAAMKDTGTASVKAARDAEGSFNQLEKELKQNEAALKKMAIGSKEFDQQKMKVDGLRKSLAGAKGELKGVADQSSAIGKAGGDALGDIKSMALQFLTVQAVVQAISSELDHVSKLKLEAAQTQRTFEQAIADVGQNIGAENVAPAKQMIIEQAPKLGVTQEGLANLIGVAISAGAKDLEEAMALSAAALKLTVGDAAKAQALVGGTLDVASLGGSTNFEGALGQILQTQSQVRSTNLAEFAANIGPGLAAATAKGQHMEGMTTERSLEIASVISQVIKDQTGANTATTLRQFVTRLDSFAPEREKKLDDGGTAKVAQKDIDSFKQATTFDERIQMMRSNEALMLQFLETQRESIGKTAVREIISGSDRAVAFEDKAKKNIGSIDDAQSFFKNLVDETGKQTAHLSADRKHAAVIQKAETTGDRATEGQVQKLVQETIDKMNLSGIDKETQGTIRNRLRIGAAQGENPIDTGITALEEAKGQRKLFGVIPAGGDVSEADKQTADETIGILREMKANLVSLNADEAMVVQPVKQQPVVASEIKRVESEKSETILKESSVVESNTEKSIVERKQEPGSSAVKQGVVEKNAERPTKPAIVERKEQPVPDKSKLKASQKNADEANTDLTENKMGLMKQARQERADAANAALLEEQNRLMKEQNELLKQQNQKPAQAAPVAVKVQAPATRPKEAPLPERLQP